MVSPVDASCSARATCRNRLPVYGCSVVLLAAGCVFLWHEQYLIAILLGISVTFLALYCLALGLRRANGIIEGAAAVLDAPSTQAPRSAEEEQRATVEP